MNKCKIPCYKPYQRNMNEYKFHAPKYLKVPATASILTEPDELTLSSVSLCSSPTTVAIA